MESRALSVVVFCPTFRPLVGGAERLAETLAAELVTAGCRVKILTPRVTSDSPGREEVNGVIIERFPLADLSRRYPVPGIAVLNIPYVIWQVGRAVRSRLDDADVLHGHTGSLPTAAAALVGRMKGIPVVCTAHVADQRSDLGEIEKTGATGWLVAWLTRKVIGTWVAITAAVADALIRAGVDPTNVVRIPNGVHLPTVSRVREPAKGVCRFLYLGRLSANSQRDIPTLVAAFDRLATNHTGVELAIVGGGDLYDETRLMADACQAGGRIRLLGFDDAKKWLIWADCFVLPSRREGLSVALLEAMASDLPCIANDIPPNREVLADGDAGILVPVGDVQALEDAMRRLVEKPECAAHYARKAKERIAHYYTIEAVARQYQQLYMKLRQPSGRSLE